MRAPARTAACAGLLLLVACTAPPEKPLCDAYADLGASVQQVCSLDLGSATPDEIRSAAEAVTFQLTQVRTAAAGQIDMAASDLRLALDDFRASVPAVDAQDQSLSRTLLQRSWQDVVVAYQPLQRPLDVQCGRT